MYLMIQNVGVAPSEGFTLIGVSTTRNAGCARTIGKFGSGTKFAINYLLRNNIDFYIYCGKLCIKFKTEKKKVSDGLREDNFNQVVARLDCSEASNQIHRTEKLSWTTEHGIDWTLDMAMREFIANALDRTIREGKSPEAISIETVKDNQVRAKDGHTRIFIQFTPEVARYFAEIDKRFLHFRELDNAKHSTILEKTAARSFSSPTATVYKEGVFVRQKGGELPSLFDYNINHLTLDESRNAADYSIVSHITQLIANEKDAVRRNKLLSAVIKDEHVQEVRELSSYQFDFESDNADIKKRWQETWNNFLPDNSILNTSTETLNSHITKKGYNPVIIKSPVWKDFLVKCGIPTEETVLSDNEKQGITELPPTEAVKKAAKEIWDLLRQNDALNGAGFPELKVFNKFMDAGSLTLGYYSNGVVYIHESLADGTNKMLRETMLEELVHHITKATDLSRDFQDYLIRLCIKLAF